MRNLLLAAALVGLSGCYKAEIVNIDDGPAGLEHTKKVHTLISGLVPLNDIDASDVCNDKGVLKVTVVHGFVDMLLGGITLGIYAPVTVKVVCKG